MQPHPVPQPRAGFGMSFNPVKPRDHGSPKAAVAALFAECGGIKRVAVLLPGAKKSQLYGYTDPGDDAEIRYVQVAALTRPGCTAAAEYLAHLAGAVLLPIGDVDGPCVVQLSAAAARQHGEAIARVVEAMADGRMSAAEARGALPELDDALRALAQLRAMIAARGREPA